MAPERTQTLAPDFGRTADDYRAHRAGFPAELLPRLQRVGVGLPTQRVLDVGTGTGSLARLLAPAVGSVTAIDPAPELLAAAAALDREAGVTIAYRVATAEDTGEPEKSFDVVTAGQSWAWFDRPRATRELRRVLRPRGFVVIAQLDWLPLPGTIVDATEQLILSHNERWHLAGGTGVYPEYLTELAVGGFERIETFSFDIAIPYTFGHWVGRIRASAGVAASLGRAEVSAFSTALTRELAPRFRGRELRVAHRVWVVTARAPEPANEVRATGTGNDHRPRG